MPGEHRFQTLLGRRARNQGKRAPLHCAAAVNRFRETVGSPAFGREPQAIEEPGCGVAQLGGSAKAAEIARRGFPYQRSQGPNAAKRSQLGMHEA